MNITINTDELKNAVSATGKVMPNPNVKGVLVRIKEGVTFVTTNLEQAIEYSVNAGNDVKDEVELLFPFDTFRDIVSKIKDEIIDMEIFDKHVVLKDRNGNFSLNTMSPDTFPLVPDVDATINLSFKFKELKELVESTIFAAAKKEESRREFKGVYLDIKEDYINFVGTDATALALNRVENTWLPQTSLIIPWKTLDVLTHLPYEDEQVDIAVSESNVQFKLPNLKITSVLINGQFPDYTTIIPGETEFYAKVSKDALMDALDIVGVFAKKGTGRIVFTFTSNKLIVESASSDIGSGKKEITCETNANMTLHFYAEKIIEGIEHVQGDMVYFGIQDVLKPVLIKGTENENYVYIIMPQKPIV